MMGKEYTVGPTGISAVCVWCSYKWTKKGVMTKAENVTGDAELFNIIK